MLMSLDNKAVPYRSPGGAVSFGPPRSWKNREYGNDAYL